MLSVVGYHLWPARLTGGFVGVDIFFAISGFLITAHLVREVDRTGRVSLLHFWARRARRLLPASLLVLVSTAVLVVLFVPQSFWLQYFREIGAATIYLENWQLAADAVDYLAAESAASPVQHFWSLSAEEQFYIVWPLIVVASVLLAGRRASAPRRRLFVVTALAIVTLASLVFSVLWTAQDAASAYFITPTRAWEFGAGGLLGILAADFVRRPVGRTAVSWLGWGAILFSVLVYSDALPFPGFVAAVPVLGTLAVIWGGAPTTAWSATRLVSLRPVQFIGDLSYSLYLWHWPLIVITPFVIGHDLGTRTKLAILGLSIVLALLTKIVVEDPVRLRGFFAERSPRTTFIGIAVASAVVIAAMGGGSLVVQREIAATAERAATIADAGVDCFGAAGMDPACVEPQLEGVLVPAPVPFEDKSDAFTDDCVLDHDTSELIRCHYGSEEPDASVVALVGDSHAVMWLPAFQELADAKNWRIEVFAKNGCAYTGTDSTPYLSDSVICERWKDNVDVGLAELPGLTTVFTSYRSALVEADAAVTTQGFIDRWQPIVDRGVKLYAIADIPQMAGDGVACVDLHQDSGDYSSCELSRDVAFQAVTDTQEAAALAVGAGFIDLNPYLCDAESCYMVIGHVMAFYDRYHVTATYARTVSPYLEAQLK